MSVKQLLTSFVLLIGITSTIVFSSNKVAIKNVSELSNVITSTQNNATTSVGSITIFGLGDMMFDRGVRLAMARGINPFEGIHFDNNSFKIKADYVTANLEGPITDATRCQVKAYSFKFATTTGYMLKQNGIDAVNLANNHGMDCFQKGYEDTKKYLLPTGVVGFGGYGDAVNTKEVTVKGHTVALVGIDTKITAVDMAKISAKIAELKTRNEYVIVNIHWGEEYFLKPTAEQISMAHVLIDAGTDVIFGHHPHVVEPVEVYKGKTIFYSLGNFIFDQTDEIAKKGIVGSVTLKEDGTETYQTFPYYIDHATPRLIETVATTTTSS